MKNNTITIDKYLAAIILLVCFNAGYLLGGYMGREIQKEKMLHQRAQP